MDSIELLGYVEVYRKPEYGKMVAWMAVAVAVVAAMVWGFVRGHLYMVVGFAPLGWALAASRRAASSKITKQVGVGISFADGVFRIYLPKTRLYDSRYVDQYYMCSVDDIESVTIDESGCFSLRAKKVESFASEGESAFDHRTNPFCEVSFMVDADGRSASSALFERHGVPCQQYIRG